MTYTAKHNGQTFSTKGSNANFVVVVPVVKAKRIENTERRIALTTSRIGSMALALGESEASREHDAKLAKDVKNLEKHLTELLSIEGNIYFELESWHGTKPLAETKARRVGGIVLASVKVGA